MITIAYYLGQFHPSPDNDEFWGKGFTEWHNVARARSLYPGHGQPQIPGDFGFYDLRCDETILEQMRFAKSIGVDVFCHWHYWFAGRRLLHRPLDSMIRLNTGQVKFMLGWANESWTGVWHGTGDKVLIQQTYSLTELEEHAKLIATYIQTGQCLEIDGRWPFLIYKPLQIPSCRTYLDELRRAVHRHSGKRLYIIGNWSPGSNFEFSDPCEHGLDAAVVTPVAAFFEFPMLRRVYGGLWHVLRRLQIGPEVRSYKATAETMKRAKKAVKGTVHATVVTGWDNTPRSGRRGLVLSGYDEETLRKALLSALELERGNTEKLLFLKSWNEWAEGNVIEPRFAERWSVGEVIREVLAGRDEPLGLVR